MDRPWKAPLAQKLIRPSSCTFRISTPGTWLRHAVPAAPRLVLRWGVLHRGAGDHEERDESRR